MSSFNGFKEVTAGDELAIQATERVAEHNDSFPWGFAALWWGKNTCYKPQRYTKEFIDKGFFKEEYKKALSFCGSHSGRDCDKAKETGLTPVFVSENGVEVTAFAEADMVLVCKKAYVQEMKPECFVDTENDEKWYSDKDYHYQYIGEIVKAFVKE